MCNKTLSILCSGGFYSWPQSCCCFCLAASPLLASFVFRWFPHNSCSSSIQFVPGENSNKRCVFGKDTHGESTTVAPPFELSSWRGIVFLGVNGKGEAAFSWKLPCKFAIQKTEASVSAAGAGDKSFFDTRTNPLKLRVYYTKLWKVGKNILLALVVACKECSMFFLATALLCPKAPIELFSFGG